MLSAIPTALAYAAIGYAGVGLLVALAFILVGLNRTHPAAHGAWAFRPLLIPGLALLWPYVALRWRRGAVERGMVAGQRSQRVRHARIWLAIAAIPALILLAGLGLRQTNLVDAPPLLLTPPS